MAGETAISCYHHVCLILSFFAGYVAAGGELLLKEQISCNLCRITAFDLISHSLSLYFKEAGLAAISGQMVVLAPWATAD